MHLAHVFGKQRKRFQRNSIAFTKNRHFSVSYRSIICLCQFLNRQQLKNRDIFRSKSPNNCLRLSHVSACFHTCVSCSSASDALSSCTYGSPLPSPSTFAGPLPSGSFARPLPCWSFARPLPCWSFAGPLPCCSFAGPLPSRGSTVHDITAVMTDKITVFTMLSVVSFSKNDCPFKITNVTRDRKGSIKDKYNMAKIQSFSRFCKKLLNIKTRTTMKTQINRTTETPHNAFIITPITIQQK